MFQHTDPAAQRPTVVAVWEAHTGAIRTIDPATRESFTVATAHTYAAGQPGARVLTASNGAPFEPMSAPGVQVPLRLARRANAAGRIADRIIARFNRR